MNVTVIAETIRRHLTNVIFLAFALVVLMIAFAIGQTDNPGAIWTSMFTLVVLVAGSELIGPEFSSGTLQLILVKPVNRSTYLLSRWLGAVATVWIVAWSAFAVESISRFTDGTEHLIGRTAIATLNVSVRAMLICALLALFGSFLRAYFHVGLYFVVQMLLLAMLTLLDLLQRADRGFFAWLAMVVRRNPVIRRSIVELEANLFPELAMRFDRAWLLLVVTNCAIALLLACLLFRRREVPYGAD